MASRVVRKIRGMGRKCVFCKHVFQRGEVSKWVMTSDRYPKEVCASCAHAMK